MSARILVVDDARANPGALLGLLRREGYQVTVAAPDAAARDDGAVDLVLGDPARSREPAAGEGGAPAERDAIRVAVDPTLAFGEAKRRAVAEFERTYLLRALRRHRGNVSRTAEAIGMVRQSLQQKIRELGLRGEDWRAAS